MAERIAHERDATPRVRLQVALDDASGTLRSLNRRHEVVHDDVEVNGCPVSAVVPNCRSRARCCSARSLLEEINSARGPGHLGNRVIEEMTLEGKTEPRAVEFDSLIEVIDMMLTNRRTTVSPAQPNDKRLGRRASARAAEAAG